MIPRCNCNEHTWPQVCKSNPISLIVMVLSVLSLAASTGFRLGALKKQDSSHKCWCSSAQQYKVKSFRYCDINYLVHVADQREERSHDLFHQFFCVHLKITESTSVGIKNIAGKWTLWFNNASFCCFVMSLVSRMVNGQRPYPINGHPGHILMWRL